MCFFFFHAVLVRKRKTNKVGLFSTHIKNGANIDIDDNAVNDGRASDSKVSCCFDIDDSGEVW